MSSEVFISYKREEQPKARVIAHALVARGHNVWWDVELLLGDKFDEELVAVIKKAKAAIVLWSEKAVSSDFVRDEALLALKKKNYIPVNLDGCELPLAFGRYNTLDLKDWSGDPNDKILEPLFAAVEKKTGLPAKKLDNSDDVDQAIFGSLVQGNEMISCISSLLKTKGEPTIIPSLFTNGKINNSYNNALVPKFVKNSLGGTFGYGGFG
ncbi:MAG: toll/interleukin-1 receptor domain-containing protein [Candidatus Thiodiazotropha sp. (ex Troendleina suluensis)]|nr:toll/interleukin-1 receptor domain-containing protein [Candidatus Thiodiazotropha sp. (ex Troendleina suluensis)]